MPWQQGDSRRARHLDGAPELLPAGPGMRHDQFELPTGIRVHLATAGPEDGPAVLALHGWPQHWWMWRYVMAGLAADGFHVLCPDSRGLGWSSAPADHDFRKQRLVDDARALLDALGIRSAAVVGHDWGGWVGFLLARRHPERVDRLLAASIAAPWRNARPRPADVAFAYQPLVAAPKLGPALVRRPRFLEALMRGASARDFAWEPSALRAFAAVTSAPGPALASSLYYRDFLTRELGGVRRHGDAGGGSDLRMPVLQLVGAEDLVRSRVAPPPPSLPDWRLEIVPRCGHFLFDEHPGFALERTRRFLAGD